MRDHVPACLGRLILRLPHGFAEDPLEFLLSATLGFAGLVQFLLPAILLGPAAFAAFPFPFWLIPTWGAFFVLGGAMASVGILLRGRSGLLHWTRALESIGLTLLCSSTLSYALLSLTVAHSLGAVASVLLLFAVAIGLGLRAAILTPGIYERLLRRELDREVKRITGR